MFRDCNAALAREILEIEKRLHAYKLCHFTVTTV